MEDLEEVIGEGRVLELSFDSRHGQGATELWDATLKRLDYRDDDDGDDEGTETVLATARLARVDFSADWLSSLDAESGSLEAVGGAFYDLDRIVDLDENAISANSLVIVDWIEVVEEHRGSLVSHDLVRGIGRVFHEDLVALSPTELAEEGVVRFEALRRYWERAGFVRVPETEVLMLPLGSR